jgi:signal transduction histidine kinase
MYLSSDAGKALEWARIGFVGIIFIPILAYNFILVFLGVNNKRFLYFAYLSAIPSLILSRTPYVYVGISKHSWGYYPIAGKFYIVFLLLFSLLFITGVALLYKKMRDLSASELKRKQIAYVFTAFCIGTFGVVDYIAKYPSIQIYPFGYACALFFISIIAYAIVRHSLMDIKVIIRKTLVFAGLFVVSYAVFVTFAYLPVVAFENVIQNRLIAMIPSVLIMVVMLRPLENFLRAATDKVLFQKKYDYKHLLKTFTDEVLTVLELSELVNITVNKLVDILKLENAVILLYEEVTDDYRMAGVIGLDDDQYALSGRDGLVGYMQASGKHVLLEDLGRQKSFIMQHDANVERLKASVFIPLMHQKKIVGVLSLGKKKSDEIFTQDDIDILIPLARALSIAITNAQLFVKLSQAQANAAQKEKMAVIGTLSAGINHEICNPLGIARGQCEMFLLNMQEGLYKDKSQEELLEKAQVIMAKVIHETDRATVITRKLSSFAKPAKGRIDDNVKVEDEINEVISLLEHDLSLENITLHKDIEKGLPTISADRKQIQEIFFNIVRNAAQSIKSSGQIILRAVSTNRKVYIDIKDTGSGISKKHLGQIFDPFFTTKDPGQGTGLGLFIVKQIVEKNNGYISVQSELGMGTTFKLVFNASSPSPVESSGDSTAGPEEGSLSIAG